MAGSLGEALTSAKVEPQGLMVDLMMTLLDVEFACSTQAFTKSGETQLLSLASMSRSWQDPLPSICTSATVILKVGTVQLVGVRSFVSGVIKFVKCTIMASFTRRVLKHIWL